MTGEFYKDYLISKYITHSHFEDYATRVVENDSLLVTLFRSNKIPDMFYLLCTFVT